MKTPAPEPYFINRKGSSAGMNSNTFVWIYKAFKNNFFIQHLPWMLLYTRVCVHLYKHTHTYN